MRRRSQAPVRFEHRVMGAHMRVPQWLYIVELRREPEPVTSERKSTRA